MSEEEGNEQNPVEGLFGFLAKIAGGAMLAKGHELGHVHDHAADVMPSADQVALVPGDHVAISAAEDADDEDAPHVGIIVDPTEHVEQFPDHEDRDLKGYMLLRYWNQSVKGELGWFSRPRLIPLDEPEFLEMLSWTEGVPYPEELPVWLLIKFNKSSKGLAEANRETLPDPLPCFSCGEYAMLLRVFKSRTQEYAMGINAKEQIESVGSYSDERDITATWHCRSCGYEREVSEDEKEIMYL